MRTILKNVAWMLFVALAVGGARPAWADGDDAIPYPEEDSSSSGRKLPRRSDPTYVRPEETGVEKADREESLANLDDPNTGLAFELLIGAMLLDSSRGAWVDGRFAYGGRFTWEFGRILGSPQLRDALWVDALYAHVDQHDGTAIVSNDTAFNYVSVAPAYEFKFSDDSPFGLYLQLGGGAASVSSTLHTQGADWQIAGFKPLIQYGVGLRGTPKLGDNGPRISFRLEVTRFHRGYLDDTFLGGSVGIAF